MRSIPRRTAVNIRTITSNWIGHRANPRRKYLRLAKLEFDKANHGKQLQRAMERAEDHQIRLAEIEQEQAYLLASAEAARKGEPMPSEIPRRATPPTTKRRGGADFVLKY